MHRRWLQQAFKNTFTASAQSNPAVDARSNEDDGESYAQRVGRWRRLALVLTQTNASGTSTFLATVRISLVTKAPLTHALNWSQQRTSEEVAARKAIDDDGPYIGKTMLTDFISFKAGQIRDEMSALLLPISEASYCRVWEALPDTLHAPANELIVTLVVCQHAEWDRRVMCEVQHFALQLLSDSMLEEPSAQPAPAPPEGVQGRHGSPGDAHRLGSGA